MEIQLSCGLNKTHQYFLISLAISVKETVAESNLAHNDVIT